MRMGRWTQCALLLAVCYTGAAGVSRAQTSISTEDRNEIQQLSTSYLRALFGCDAEAYADLFAPETGYFASGFRGRMVGKEQLIALVESEPHCLEPGDATPRAAADGPTVALEVTPGGVRGTADLGTAEYQDEYAKTPEGWRFASRTVILPAEKVAGLDAAGLLAIQRLERPELGNYYTPDANGIERLLVSGVAVSVDGDNVTGRAYLKDGGYVDEVYDKLDSGSWRIVSSVSVPSGAP